MSCDVRIWLRVAFALALVGGVGCKPGGPFSEGGYDSATLKFFPENLASLPDVVNWRSVDDDNAVVTIRAKELISRSITIAGESYTQLRVPGFKSESSKGEPEIPSVTFLVKIPRGKTLKYEVIAQANAEPEVLEYLPAFQHRSEVHNGKLQYMQRDVESYRSNFGESAISILDESFAETEKFAVVRFYPLAYSASKNAVRLRTETQIHFEFVASYGLADESAPVGGNALSVFSDLSVNGPSSVGTHAGEPVDLIIADQSYQTALQGYIQFKATRGRKVVEEYVSGGASTEQIKQLIRKHYATGTPPRNTMLVGNIDQIKSFPGSGDNTWTDWPYQTMDGGGLPDISLGRIPAHNVTELQAWIEKAKARETGQRNIGDVLLTAGNDVAMGCPTNVAQVGQNLTGGGGVTTRKQFRSEGASTEQVFAAYNASPNIIVYDGHGDQQGMSEIPMVIRDLPKLTNQSFPLILDIACLNANWRGGASARNFAESVLLSPGRGAAGIMAAGGSSGGHSFFQNIGSIMAKGKQAGANHANKLNEIGQVILAAKANANGADQSFFNYYGDPASSVWEAPTATSVADGTDTTQPPAVTGKIFAMLTDDNKLYVAVDVGAAAPSYCLGDAAACGTTATFTPLIKGTGTTSRDVYQVPTAVTPSATAQIQIRSGTISQGLRFQSR